MRKKGAHHATQPDLFFDPDYSLPAGRKARDEGIAQVSEHDPELWRTSYRGLVRTWFDRLAVGSSFTGEALRRHARFCGLEEPHHANAWGGNAAPIIRGWLADGRIAPAGMASAELKASHARRYPQYKKLR